MASGGAARNDATSMLRSSASRLMGIARAGATPAKLGASPSGKAADFDSAIRRFESSRPSQAFPGFQTFGRARGDAGNSGVFAAGRARSRTRMRCIRGYLRLFCLPVWGRDFQMSGIPRAGGAQTGSIHHQTGSLSVGVAWADGVVGPPDARRTKCRRERSPWI